MKTEQVSNETIESTDEELNDLPVTEEQGEEARGGIVPTTQHSLNFVKIEYK